jgi:Chaperone of endosialidase
LRVQGTAESTQAAFNVISDKRTKTDIAPLKFENALAKVMKLAERISEFKFINMDGTHVGHIAQEVQEIAPELVRVGKLEWQTGVKTWVETEEVEVEKTRTITEERPVLDENGEPVLKKNGKPETEFVEVEETYTEVEKRDVEKSEPIVETYEDGLTIDSSKFSMLTLQALGEAINKINELETRLSNAGIK